MSRPDRAGAPLAALRELVEALEETNAVPWTDRGAQAMGTAREILDAATPAERPS